MTDWKIVEAREELCRSHLQTINEVAVEGRYLSTNKGFSYEDILSFFYYCKQNGFPQFYVVNGKDEAVGWCDIVVRDGYDSKTGFIGIGLRPEYRERGVGTALMLHAMEAARVCGFRTIRLDCRASNRRAIHVYRKLGFRTEWWKRRTMEIGGETVPLVCMVKRLRTRESAL